MKNKSNRTAIAWGGAATLLAFGLTAHPVMAQDAAPVAPPASAAADASKRQLDATLSQISKGAGVTVVTNATLAKTLVTPPAEAATPANFESQIAELVKTLPRGTTWARLMLPASPNARGYSGDAVAEYALAQSKLFGAVGGAAPAGTIEVLGKNVGADKAETVASALDLKPVYIIMNPKQMQAGMDSSDWAKMTPEQQKAAADQQARQILNMDPAARQQYMGNMMQQQRAVMGSLMQNMTPEQRNQFFQTMRGAMGGGAGGPGGGWGGGRRGGN